MNMKIAIDRPSLAGTALALLLNLFTPLALAHHPHDLVDALAVSPSFEEDNTVYIASSGHVLKSVHGGHGWQELVNGLDHTSPVTSILIIPSDTAAEVLLVATDGNGIYRSSDKGASWQNTSKGLESLELDTLSGGIQGKVLAIDESGHLYLSTDSGETWHPSTLPETAVITAADVSASRMLAGDKAGNLYASTDGGAHWVKAAALPSQTAIATIKQDPSDTTGNTFFVGTRDHGLFRTTDNGRSFQQAGRALKGHHIISLAVQPGFMIATTWKEAAFISTDEGNSWTKYSDGLLTDKQANTVKYFSPQFRQIAIAGKDGKTLFLAGFAGLFKSGNHGKNWDELEILPVSLIKGLDVSPSDNDDYSIAISTYGGGAYFSHDHGDTWVIANKGLNTTRLMDMHYSPTYSQDHTLFSGSVGLLLKSTDRNGSWEQIPVSYRTLKNRIIGKLIRWGLPQDLGWSYLDKVDKVPVYPVTMAPSTDYANDNTVIFGTRWHGIYRSEHGGLEAYNAWLHTDGAITGLKLSPNYTDDHTVLAYVRGDGIYKSTDTGDNWNKLVKGLPADATSGMKIGTHSSNEDYTLAFSPGYKKDRTVFAAGPSGLYVSTDQGENWNEIHSDTLGNKPHIVAFALSPDYTRDRTMLVSLKGRGLYRTVNGGKQFDQIGKSLIENNHSITRMAFASQYASNRTIYAASSQDLFRSDDGGDHWTLLQRPARYEDQRGVIHYTGNWKERRGDGYSATSIHDTSERGATVSLDFYGCGVRWIASKSPDGGKARVYLDDAPVATVDLAADKTQDMAVAFSRTGLTCGPHSIRVEAGTGTDKAGRISFDAFDVLPEKPVLSQATP